MYFGDSHLFFLETNVLIHSAKYFISSFIPKNIFSERNKKYYFDTGAIYVFYAHLIRDKKPILDLSYTEAVRVNQMAFFDIDYEFHLDLARAFFSISGWEVNK